MTGFEFVIFSTVTIWTCSDATLYSSIHMSGIDVKQGQEMPFGYGLFWKEEDKIKRCVKKELAVKF